MEVLTYNYFVVDLYRLIGMYACMYDCVCVSMYIWFLNAECLSFVFCVCVSMYIWFLNAECLSFDFFQIFRSQDYNAVYYCMKEVIF